MNFMNDEDSKIFDSVKLTQNFFAVCKINKLIEFFSFWKIKIWPRKLENFGICPLICINFNALTSKFSFLI